MASLSGTLPPNSAVIGYVTEGALGYVTGGALSYVTEGALITSAQPSSEIAFPVPNKPYGFCGR